MKRSPGPRPVPGEDQHLWSLVAATVRPFPGRKAPRPPEAAAPVAQPSRAASQADRVAMPALRSRVAPPARPPEGIEPNRRRRIARGRETLAMRLDLHGHDQDRARARLGEVLMRAHAEGARAVLVITGKGIDGHGVLRRRVPEWLAEPPLRALVAGFTVADRRDGGEGALYVALRRPGR